MTKVKSCKLILCMKNCENKFGFYKGFGLDE